MTKMAYDLNIVILKLTLIYFDSISTSINTSLYVKIIQV